MSKYEYNQPENTTALIFLFESICFDSCSRPGQRIAVTTVCTYIYIAGVEKIRTKGGIQVSHAATPGRFFSLIAV